MGPPPLVDDVAARIWRREIERRLGPGAAAPDRPGGGPPVTVLTSRVFPVALLERRRRVLAALGWLPERVPVWSPAGPSRLPAEASVADELAVAAMADVIEAHDAAGAALGAALGVAVSGHAVPEDPEADRRWWDDAADRAADGLCPGWRALAGTRPGFHGRAEALTLAGDAWFGRGRRVPAWSLLHRGLWQLVELKRRVGA